MIIGFNLSNHFKALDQNKIVTCAPKLPSFSGRVSNHEGDYYEAIPFQRRTDYCDIKEQENGLPTKDVCRRMASARQRFINGRASMVV